MNKALPPLGWFRAFDAAARHLNFTLAAEELGLTQSAVSQHIRALETRLGSPLFLRRPKGLALTDAGRRLVSDVAAAMARLREATAGFLPEQDRMVLTVATSVSIAQWIIAPGLPDLQAAMPDLRLRLVTAVWPDDFAAAEADVEIRFGSKEVAGRDQARALGSFDLVGVVHPTRFGDASGLSAKRIAELPLIQPVGVTETWDKVLRAEGMPAPARPALQVDSHALAVDLAISGAGPALTNLIIAGPALAEGRLCRLPLPVVRGSEGYFLSQRKGEKALLAQGFVDWLTARVDQAALDADLPSPKLSGSRKR